MPDFQSKELLGCRLEVRLGALIEQTDLDAVVVPTNKQLSLGWGSHIAEAVLQQGGQDIEQEALEAVKIQYPRGCPLGGAVLTGAGKLPFKHLIHAAVLDKFNMNPLIFLKLRQRTSDSTLIEAVCSSLSRADDSNIRSLGFSLLGTDVGGMKKQKCAHILIRTCEDYISQTHTKLNLIAFVAPKAEDAEILEQTLHQE
ncbi:MAG TPA: hypothetical protein EYO33_16035 [Phycisphaerales bacterium]|nr:hypothetical protein [Phycisphaerales bacterium]